MSKVTLKFSTNADADINRMARQLGIDTSDITSMTVAVLKKALGLCQYVLDEKDKGGIIAIDDYERGTRKEIHVTSSP